MGFGPVLCLVLALWPVWVNCQAANGPVPRLGGMRAAMGRTDPRFGAMLERFAWSTSVHGLKSTQARDDFGRPRGLEGSMAKEGPGSTRATIQHAPGPTDGNVSSQVRQTLSWNRVKQRVAKRELKKQLRECQSSLDACQTARDAPSSLFVQMAGHCTLDKKAGRYFLRSEDMDVDTYVF